MSHSLDPSTYPRELELAYQKALSKPVVLTCKTKKEATRYKFLFHAYRRAVEESNHDYSFRDITVSQHDSVITLQSQKENLKRIFGDLSPSEDELAKYEESLDQYLGDDHEGSRSKDESGRPVPDNGEGRGASSDEEETHLQPQGSRKTNRK